MIKRIILLYIPLFLGINLHGFSQGQGNSPYSVFGLGELTDDSFGPQDMMGGTGVSFTNTFYLNEINPALLSKGRVISGLKYVGLGVGATGHYRNLEQDNNINQDFALNLSRLSIAFPIVSRWTTGFNFRPYTVMDSEYESSVHFEGSSTIATNHYKDQGAISKVGFVNSVTPVRGLYLGVEAQYLFGSINRDTLTSFLGSGDYIKYGSRSRLSGFSLKSGAAYQQKLVDNWFLNLGATYQMDSKLKGEYIHIFQTLSDTQADVGPAIVGPTDTLGLTTTSSGLPSKYKVGFSIEKPFNWLIALDYGLTNWEDISHYYQPSSVNTYKNSTELGVGLEWVPGVASSGYFSQVFYRVGFKTVNTPYFINNTRIKDNSFSFGLSLPMGHGTNYFDVGVAFGQRGTTINSLVKENYVKFSVSLSLVRDWFHRPTIN